MELLNQLWVLTVELLNQLWVLTVELLNQLWVLKKSGALDEVFEVRVDAGADSSV